MDFVTPLYKTLEAQATLDQAKATAVDTQALAQMRQQSVLLGNIQMQQRTNTMNALQQATQGNVFDPSLEPQPDDSPVDATRKAAARSAQQAQFSRKAAQLIMQNGGDPSTARQYMQEADVASWRSAQAQRESLAEQKNLTSQIASIAGTATDDDTADAAYQQMIAIAPKIAQGMTFDRDPMSGKVVMGDQTTRNFNILKAAGITAEQQFQNATKLQDQLDKQKIEERRLAKEKLDEQLTSQRIANERELTNLHRAQAANVGVTKPAKPMVPGAATPAQKNSAADDIMAQDEFKDQKFDASMSAFAADVADRANKIRAAAHNAGQEEIGLDEARQQAIDDLKGYVTDKRVKTASGIFNDTFETRKTYTRRGPQAAAGPGGAASPAGGAGGPPEVRSQADYDALPKGATYVWNGKTLTKK